MISQKPLRVNLFKLSEGKESDPLSDLLKLIDALDLEQRTRKVGYQDYRLETIEAPHGAHSYWLLDFCKLRYDDGPGRASRAAPTKSFDLAEDEGFAEETAVLYDPDSGFLVIQYNHHGPRSGVIATYLSAYDHENVNDYEFLLQLNPDAQARLDDKKIFSKLQIKVAPSLLSKAFKKANVAVVTTLEKTQELYKSDYVAITVGLEARSNASLTLHRWLKAFKEMATDERNAVDTLIISGRDELGAALDPVDLINEKLEFEYRDIELDDGRRLTWESRRSALVRSYNGWRKQGLIKRRP